MKSDCEVRVLWRHTLDHTTHMISQLPLDELGEHVDGILDRAAVHTTGDAWPLEVTIWLTDFSAEPPDPRAGDEPIVDNE
jgi:hypothetical protein